MLQHLSQAKKAGVIAASAGNHAQGVAAISRQLGIQAHIVMPTVTPPIKVANTQDWGAHVELVGDVYNESFAHAQKLSQEKGYLLVHPFCDTDIIAGQGTIGLELFEEPGFQDIEAIVIPIGGGGLITGCATALKALKPSIKVYGVTARNAPATWTSFHKRKQVQEPVRFTLADGISTKGTDDAMLPLLLDCVDDVFSISEESIAHAIALLAERAKMVVEGAGAIPVAAVLENLVSEKKIAIVLSGGNIDLPALSHVLNRGLCEQGRLVRLLITILDRPGGLNAVTQVLAARQANILQIFHQRSMVDVAVGEAVIEVEMETRGHEHTEEIVQALIQQGFRVERA